MAPSHSGLGKRHTISVSREIVRVTVVMFCNEHILERNPKAFLVWKLPAFTLSFRICVLSSCFEIFDPFESNAQILHVF